MFESRGARALRQRHRFDFDFDTDEIIIKTSKIALAMHPWEDLAIVCVYVYIYIYIYIYVCVRDGWHVRQRTCKTEGPSAPASTISSRQLCCLTHIALAWQLAIKAQGG